MSDVRLTDDAVTVEGSLGINTTHPARALHVDNSEIHTSGKGGGFSFASRSCSILVDQPVHGERYVWYANDGVARLWSGSDLLTVSNDGVEVKGLLRVDKDTHILGNLAAWQDLRVRGKAWVERLGVGSVNKPLRPLHVGEGEAHSEQGYSFSDRQATAFVETPQKGERWVLYASDGTARIWSGSDRVTIDHDGTFNVTGVVQAHSVSASEVTTSYLKLNARHETDGHRVALSAPDADTLEVNGSRNFDSVRVGSALHVVPPDESDNKADQAGVIVVDEHGTHVGALIRSRLGITITPEAVQVVSTDDNGKLHGLDLVAEVKDLRLLVDALTEQVTRLQTALKNG